MSNCFTDLQFIFNLITIFNFVVFIFSPGNPEPIYVRKNTVEKDVSILGACFVPNLQENEASTVSWQKKSQFFFLDSDQVCMLIDMHNRSINTCILTLHLYLKELLTLESKSESNIALENLSTSRNLPLTTFNRMLATERISNVEKPMTDIHDYTRLANKGMVDEVSVYFSKIVNAVECTLFLKFVARSK